VVGGWWWSTHLLCVRPMFATVEEKIVEKIVQKERAKSPKKEEFVLSLSRQKKNSPSSYTRKKQRSARK